MAYQVSAIRVLSRDWPCFGLSVFMAICWLVGVGGYLAAVFWFPQNRDAFVMACTMGLVAAFVTALCGSIVRHRMNTIRNVFRTGEVVHGQVHDVGHNTEDIGYAVVGYQFQGQQYYMKNVTEGSRRRVELTPGETVDIVVDPSQPTRAFIAKLYID